MTAASRRERGSRFPAGHPGRAGARGSQAIAAVQERVVAFDRGPYARQDVQVGHEANRFDAITGVVVTDARGQFQAFDRSAEGGDGAQCRAGGWRPYQVAVLAKVLPKIPGSTTTRSVRCHRRRPSLRQDGVDWRVGR